MARIEADPEHPVNSGDDCPKGLADKQIIYSPDRLHLAKEAPFEGQGNELINWGLTKVAY